MTIEEKLATEDLLEIMMQFWLLVGFVMFIMRPIFAWMRKKEEESR